MAMCYVHPFIKLVVKDSLVQKTIIHFGGVQMVMLRARSVESPIIPEWPNVCCCRMQWCSQNGFDRGWKIEERDFFGYMLKICLHKKFSLCQIQCSTKGLKSLSTSSYSYSYPLARVLKKSFFCSLVWYLMLNILISYS